MKKIKEFEEFDKPVDLVVHTKCPDKWLLIDRETGETYQGSFAGHWNRLDPVIKDKFNFTNLLNHITCRYDRMSLERVFAVLFTLENTDKPSMFGNIHTYCTWGLTYKQYIEGQNCDVPLIKIWSNR